MASHEMNLETELTCSICTEILYQPLTLLDCLHTFCGACLQLWFSYQHSTYTKTPHPPSQNPYTCPSCRAPVRATKHDARCHTLLEMFLKAHPTKAKSEVEKVESARKYKPGDVVLQTVETRIQSSRSRRRQEEDRRLVDEVRALSLRDEGEERPVSARRERRYAGAGVTGLSVGRVEGEGGRDGERRRTSRQRELPSARGDQDEMVRRHEETAIRASRQLEHQSSLRSLLSSDGGDIAMQDEIMRQIQEEGLLDGVDIENITPAQNEEIGHRIAEAYLRKHRRGGSGSVPSIVYSSDVPRTSRRRTSSQRRQRGTEAGVRSRSVSLARQWVDGTRQPQRRVTEQGRQRAVSGSERSGSPHPPRRSRHSSASVNIPPVERQDDISRPSLAPRTHRSAGSSTNMVSNTTQSLRASAPEIRISTVQPAINLVSTTSCPEHDTRRPVLSATLTGIPRTSIGDYEKEEMLDVTLIPAPLSPHRSLSTSALDRANAFGSAARPNSSHGTPLPRLQPQRFPEPNISCSRCPKTHIEYDIHYNCASCANGNWNVCIDCYRSPSIQSCNYWFGFGRSAWMRWEAQVKANDLPPDTEQPHMLTANRYRPPKSTEGGAQGRRTVTTEDPMKRLESGLFCSGCFAWSNACYWRCEICNDNDWGFCNACVDTGLCCTHPLLAITHAPGHSTVSSLARNLRPPIDSHILFSEDTRPFKPLIFHSLCSICENAIPPTTLRYHCCKCIAPANNICEPCYIRLHTLRAISPENGLEGWHRCLDGHRMQLIVFNTTGNDKQLRRIITQDIVGGIRLKASAVPSGEEATQLEMWEWNVMDSPWKQMRYVTKNVAATSPLPTSNPASPTAAPYSYTIPPPSGFGLVLIADWGWYPSRAQSHERNEEDEIHDSSAVEIEEAEQNSRRDELTFPPGAEIRECQDVNGDWWFGVYMGRGGLFPAKFARVTGA